MADAAVEFLLNNLKDLQQYHPHLITNKKKEIESVETDLRFFSAFLRESLKKGRKDERTQLLVQNIRDVVYEVEDVIDALVNVAMEKRKFRKPSINIQGIGLKVAEVKHKVKMARVDFANLQVHDEEKHGKPEVRPARVKDVVGFREVEDQLIERLTRETDFCDVVSLVGLPRIGKTTMAWKIFNDPQIIYKFPTRIWLHIYQKFSDKYIFLEILKEFTIIDDHIREKDALEISRIVVAYLETVSFLIVFDDVWSRTDWDRIRIALPDMPYTKGKVLITSRDEDVGNYASSSPRPFYRLRLFNEEENWELLRLEALGKLDCPPELENVGELIAGDFIGLPLSIVVIGGMLAAKYIASDMSTTAKDWTNVYTRIKAYRWQDDPGVQLEKFIWLSYDRLPYHLRACFLYLGLFPEDYEIPVSRLIRMWIAEGFIQQHNDYSLEEFAEMYLEDLINRNLVTIDKFKPNGKVKTCRIHDTLSDLCRTEAGSENEKFLLEIKYYGGVFVPPVSDMHMYRRLSIHSNIFEFIALKPYGGRVRSFVCFSKDEFTLLQEHIPDLFSAFKLLRVLDVKPIRLTKISSHMYQLVHARYIAISLDSSTLPSKFSQFWNLQTLIVNTTSRMLHVKADIWKLSQLRHFKTNATATLPKPSKYSKYGAELQTLGIISAESCTTKLFERACNLKKLGIRGRLALLLEGKIGSFNGIRKMKYLEKLKLVNDVHPRPASEGRLHCLPQPHEFPSRLKSITLVSTYLDWNFMSILGSLEYLEVLKLKDNAFTGTTWTAVDGGFKRLEFLQIEEADLIVWEASSHHFPRLKGLVLKKCEHLIAIPNLAEVASLQMLELYFCERAAASAKKIQAAKKEHTEGFAALKLSIFPPIL